MSIESAKACAEKLATDEVFRAQIQNTANAEERSALIQAAGYNFTQQEWESVNSEEGTTLRSCCWRT
jgi:predicted ribosomally synthesized peptide with nif11-like leader